MDELEEGYVRDVHHVVEGGSQVGVRQRKREQLELLLQLQTSARSDDVCRSGKIESWSVRRERQQAPGDAPVKSVIESSKTLYSATQETSQSAQVSAHTS